MVIIKSDVDKLLRPLLGNDQMVIDLWWTSSNLAFGGKTPLSVYQTVDNGPKIVYDYVMSFCTGAFV